MSAVVAAELYAGTRDHREKRALDRLCQAHSALSHFAYPPASAWIETGSLLRRARSTFGRMDFARHFRDLLIALEASREGATLVTENMGDFERRKTLLVSARKTLKLFNPHSVDCLTAIKFARVEQNLVRGRPCLCHSCRKLATHLDDLK